MRAFFKKFKDGLVRQTPTFQKAFSGLFKGNQLDAAAMEELEEILYTADFGHETVDEILAAIQKCYKKDKSMRGEQAAQIGASVLKQVLQGAEARLENPMDAPEVICLVGVNGSGKRQLRAKLAHNFAQQGTPSYWVLATPFEPPQMNKLKAGPIACKSNWLVVIKERTRRLSHLIVTKLLKNAATNFVY